VLAEAVEVLRKADLEPVQIEAQGLLASPLAQALPAEPAPVAQVPTVPDTEELEEVTVSGTRSYRRRNASTVTRTDTPLRDIPANIQVIPRQLIEDQGAIRIDEAVRNVSGVNFSTAFGGRNQQFNVRGFSASQYRNGQLETNGASFFNARTSPETANLERIEVLKGPASVLFGQGDPGGTINLVTKRPLASPYAAVSFTGGSFDFYRPTLDLSGPLTADGSLAYRLNLVYENTRSFRDTAQKARFFFAPVLVWKPGPATTLTFEGELLQDSFPIDRGLIFVNGTDIGLPVNRYLGDSGRRQLINEKRGYLTLTHDFTPDFTLRSQLRITSSREDYRSGEVGGPLAEDGRTLPIGGFEGGQYYETYTNRNELVWKFATGQLTHTLLFGFEFIRQTGFFYDNAFYDGNTIDIFNPTYLFSYNNRIDQPEFDGLTTANTFGIYLQDQITVSDNLKLLLAGRFDSFDYRDNYRDDSFNSVAQAQSFSPRLGIVYQPVPPASLYASYTRSFLPQFGLNISGTPFLPEQGTLYEVGVKAELFDRLSATLSTYRIEKDNVLTADPNNPRFSIQVGQQQSSGFDFDVVGEILPGWNLIASWGYIDARISRDNDFAVGNRLVNVPYHTASFWSTYRLSDGPLAGLGAGFGAFFVGNRAGDLDNSFEIDGYTRLDAALYYNREHMRVAVNFKNLLNTRFFEGSQGPLRIVPGAPFSVLATLTYQF
jgi:iron complex outermembrane receptor protein